MELKNRENAIYLQAQGYEGLALVLQQAFNQAAHGKGKERHANDLPFDDQPMQTVSELLGSADGMLFQAIKKIQESTRMDVDSAIRELLGAIVYTAGAVMFIQNRQLTQWKKEAKAQPLAVNDNQPGAVDRMCPCSATTVSNCQKGEGLCAIRREGM